MLCYRHVYTGRINTKTNQNLSTEQQILKTVKFVVIKKKINLIHIQFF